MSEGNIDSSALSLKDVDGIEQVSQKINQVKEIGKSVEDLNTNGELNDIKIAADKILDQLQEGETEIKQKKQKIEQLDETVRQLEGTSKTNYRMLTTLDTALIELEHEKAVLRKRLSSLEKLNLYIDVLSYKIYEAQHDYDNDMEELRREKEELLARQDVSEEDLAAMLSEIDKRIQGRQMMHIAAKSDLETQKATVEVETHSKVQGLDSKIEETRRKRSEALLELEDQKLFATPSQKVLIDEKMEILAAKFDEELLELKKLQAVGWAEMGSEEKLAAALELKGLKVTRSGKLITKAGKLITIEDAESMGYFDNMDMSWQKIKDALCSLELKTEEAVEEGTDELEVASDEGSLFAQMTSEDVNYLKCTLGKPLTLAMAEILVKQPRDPIHYLGHWLFKYRYNQEVEDSSKAEIAELVAERARVAKEKWQAQVMEEAQRAVLSLIVRVEEEILRREVLRAQMALQDQEEEDDDQFGQLLF